MPTITIPQSVWDELVKIFSAEQPDDLKQALAAAESAYFAAKQAMLDAEEEITRRQKLDDHLPQFDDPVVGRFSPLNLRNKMNYVREAQSALGVASYNLETATFHLQRLRKQTEGN